MNYEFSSESKNHHTNGLDPEDWEEFRRLVHVVVDDVTDHLKELSHGPVWQRPTDVVRALFTKPIPQTGNGLEETYALFKGNILPHVVGNIHPKFWGWVIGSGAPSSMVGDWLSAFVNSVPTVFDDSASLTEIQVLHWFKELFGFDNKASGILTTGASESTLIALLAARYQAFGPTIKQSGLQASRHRAVFYISDQTHDSSRKAIEILGFGEQHVRVISTDKLFSMCLDDLENQIRADKTDGCTPVAVIGTVGTTATGSSDNLNAISKICKRYNVWFHVDGAFGVFAKLSKSKHDIVRGLEHADSLAFDMHKWMYQSYDIGCVLIKDAVIHREALRVRGDYIKPVTGTITDAPHRFGDYSIQLSRGFKALKFWFSMNCDGLEVFSEAIEKNIELAGYLTSKILSHSNLELLAPTALHIVNFRYYDDDLCDEELNALNQKILQAFNETGFAIPSSIYLDGKFSIRVCISNHRTRRLDIDEFLQFFVEQAIVLVDESFTK